MQSLCRAQRETFFAVPALLGGYLRDEADLFPDSPVNKSDGVLLLDLSAVSHTETAVNAEGRLFFKTVSVGAILFGQILQIKGIGSMGQLEL
ncbi:MAG: hypothetical protein MZU95_11475 [Desulfomicrobium escambiense]|nr:hypothetical protein [Desulfomicrobium escambiense]